MPEKGRACPTGLWGCQEEARASQSVQGLRSLSKGGLGLLEDSISLLRGPVPSWRGSKLSELGASSVSCSSNFFFHSKESARHWAVETRVAPDKGTSREQETRGTECDR